MTSKAILVFLFLFSIFLLPGIILAQESPRLNPSLSGSEGNNTFLHSGEWSLTAVDLVIKGRGFDFVFIRKYESQSIYVGPLGQNWDHFYFMRLLELPNGDVFYYDGLGRKELFRALPPPNTPVIGTLLYASPPGQFAELKKLQDGSWLIHQPNSMAYLFNNYGQLHRIQDRNQNYMEFYYNPSGQMTTVIDTMGRPISYTYNADGKLTKIRDFDGREVKFNYDEGVTSPDPDKRYGFLTSVTSPEVTGTSNGNDFPQGKTTRYTYKGGLDIKFTANLLTVTSPRGESFIENEYDSEDRLTRQKYGTHFVQFRYEDQKTTVTDRRGNDSVYEFNQYGNPTAITRGGYTTRMEYDPDIIIPDLPIIPSDGLLTKITFPEGNSIEYTYEKSILNRFLRRRSEANVLSIKRVPGPRGSGGSSETLTTTHTYDQLHNLLLTVRDPKGNLTQYERNQQGNTIKITMPEGVTQSFSYNKFGQLLTETSGEGNTSTYEYYPEAEGPTLRQNPDQTTGGYLRKKTVGDLYSNTFVYDKLGRVIEFIDGNNVRSKYEVNALHQIIGETRFEPFNFQTLYEFDLNDNLIKKLVQHSSAGGDGFTEYRFEFGHPLNLLTRESQELSDGVFAETIYQYDPNGNRELIVDPEGNQTKYINDERNLNSEVIQAYGTAVAATSKTTYDGNSNPVLSTDGEHNSTQIVYDGYDRQTQTIDALGNKTQFSYDDNGNLMTEVSKDAADSLLAASSSVYDAMNRIKTRTQKFEPADAIATYNYDKANRIVSFVDARNNPILYSYDQAGRLQSVVDAVGNATSYEYDGNGNSLKITQIEKGPLGNESFATVNEFDKANRLIKVTDPAGEMTENVYDSMDNLVISIDPEGNQTAAKFDNTNRRVKLEEANGSVVTRHDFDLNGRLKNLTDTNGNTTTYGYDALNRNNQTTYPDGNQIILTHDRASNVKTITDPNGSVTTNSFDPLNRLVSRSIDKAPGVEGPISETFEYDGLSRLKKATDDDSVVEFTYDFMSNVKTESQNGRIVYGKYDALGNRTEINYPSGRQLALQYDALNRLQKIEEGGNLVADYSYQGTTRTAASGFGNGTHAGLDYDGDRRPTSIRHVNSANQVFAGFSYGWNKADQRTFEQSSHENNRADVYNYDGMYRITEVALNSRDPLSSSSAQKTISYVQDGVHNFKRIIETEGGMSRTKATQINNRNQYVVFDGQPLSYDSNGNLTAFSGKQLFSDYANRLTRVVNPDATTTTMTYDALGRRISKTVNGQTTEYSWSGQQTLEEYSGSALQASYVYGRGIDEVVQVKQAGQPYYYHLNSIGSVKAITDANGGLVESYDYKSFGGQTIRSDRTPPEVEQFRLRSGNLLMRFTEPIRSDTFAASLKDSNDQTIGFTTLFEEEDRKVILSPSSSLLPSGQYVLSIPAGVQDLMLNQMPSDFQNTFIVSGDQVHFDNKAPELEEISMTNGRQVKIRFSEEIGQFPAAAISIQSNGQPVTGSLSVNPSSMEAVLSLAETVTPGLYEFSLNSMIKDEADEALTDFLKVLLISVPDQIVYTLEKNVVASSTIGNTVGFQGRNTDSSTGLMFFRARYLEPNTGRFISPDPEGYSDSPNLYQAFLNNPANGVDPGGQDSYLILYGQPGGMGNIFKIAAETRSKKLTKSDQLMDGKPILLNTGKELVNLLNKATTSGKKLDHIIIYAHGRGSAIYFNQEVGPGGSSISKSLYVNEWRGRYHFDPGAAFVDELNKGSVNKGADVEIFSCGPLRIQGDPGADVYDPLSLDKTIGYEISIQLGVEVTGANCPLSFPETRPGVFTPRPDMGGKFKTVKPPRTP